jgi:hypothetical protein
MNMKNRMSIMIAASAFFGVLALVSSAQAGSSFASKQYGYMPNPTPNIVGGLFRNVTISSSINPHATSLVATTLMIRTPIGSYSPPGAFFKQR